VRWSSALLLLCFASGHAARAEEAPRPQDSPRLGAPASEADIARVYWSTSPDGSNLPPGRGTAVEGERLYAEHCVSCHGEGGAGGVSPVLVGGVGSLAGEQPQKTLGSYWPYSTTVFDYIRRAMPFTAPMSLSSDEYYALTAYLLQLNGIIPKDQVIDAESLPQVQMPNREGFVLAYPERPPKYATPAE